MTPNGTYASPKNKPLIRRRKTSGKEGGNKTHKEGLPSIKTIKTTTTITTRTTTNPPKIFIVRLYVRI